MICCCVSILDVASNALVAWSMEGGEVLYGRGLSVTEESVLSVNWEGDGNWTACSAVLLLRSIFTLWSLAYIPKARQDSCERKASRFGLRIAAAWQGSFDDIVDIVWLLAFFALWNTNKSIR
jgi:hypothetical protein